MIRRAIALFVASCLLAYVAFAQQAQDTISVSVKGMGMRRAIQKLFDEGQRKCRIDAKDLTGILPESVEPYQVSFDEALKQILAAGEQPLEFTKEGDVYVIRYSEPVTSLSFKDPRPLMDVLHELFQDSGLPMPKVELLLPDKAEVGPVDLPNRGLSLLIRQVAFATNPRLEVIEERGNYRLVPAEVASSPWIVTQPGHSGPVDEIEYSPDGKRIATWGEEGRVNVWDSLDGATVFSCLGRIGSNTFTPDGMQLLMAQKGFLRMVPITGEAPQRAARQLPRDILSSAYCAAANVAVGDDGEKLYVWNLNNHAEPAELNLKGQPAVYGIDKSGAYLAFAPPDPTKAGQHPVDILDLAKPTRIRQQFGFDQRPVRIRCASDGKTLAVGLDDHSIWIVNPAGAAPLAPLVPAGSSKGLRKEDVAFALSDDGKLLAYQNESYQVVVYDIDKGLVVSTLEPPLSVHYPVRALAFSPDKRHIVVSRQTFDLGTYKLMSYNLALGRVEQRFTGSTGNVSFVQFASGGKFLLSGAQSGVRVWDLSLQNPPQLFRCSNYSMQLRRNANQPFSLVGVDPASHKLTRYQLPLGKKETFDSKALPHNILASDLSGDGTVCILRDSQEKIVTWPLGSDTYNCEVHVPNAPVREMKVDQVGNHVLTVSGNQQQVLSVWSTRPGIPNLAQPQFSTSDPNPISFSVASMSRDSRHDLFAFSAEGKVHLRNFDSPQELIPPQPGSNPTLSPNGRVLAFEQEGRVVYYDVNTNTPRTLERGESAPVFNDLGDVLLTYSTDRTTVWVHQIYVKRPRVKLRADGSQISCAAVSPTGDMIAIGSDDGKVRLFKKDGKPLAVLQGSGTDDFIVSTPDNYYYASKNATRKLVFRDGLRTYHYDQFDLRCNRPDIVADRIGLSDDDTMAVMKRAYYKRLKFAGLTEADAQQRSEPPQEPVVLEPPTAPQSGNVVKFNVRLYDRRHKLKTLHMTVNGVPYHDSHGVDLSDKKTNEIPSLEVTIPLTSGDNLIRISVSNELGAESTKYMFPIRYQPAQPPKVRLFALCVGCIHYKPGDFDDLEYAKKDATDMAEALEQLKVSNHEHVMGRKSVSRKLRNGHTVVRNVMGWIDRTAPSCYSDVKVVTLLDSQATPANIRSQRKLLFDQAGPDDVVVAFFSGHGALDEDNNYYFVTPGARRKDLAHTAFSYDDIQGLMDGLQARKRLVMIDTCHAGLADITPEGIAARTHHPDEVAYSFKAPEDTTYRDDPSTFLTQTKEMSKMLELFTDLEDQTGATVISACLGGEVAKDHTGKIQNGPFTFSVLEGLKKGRASQGLLLSELRDYVIAKVESITGGAQHATCRHENDESDFRIK